MDGTAAPPKVHPPLADHNGYGRKILPRFRQNNRFSNTERRAVGGFGYRGDNKNEALPRPRNRVSSLFLSSFSSSSFSSSSNAVSVRGSRKKKSTVQPFDSGDQLSTHVHVKRDHKNAKRSNKVEPFEGADQPSLAQEEVRSAAPPPPPSSSSSSSSSSA